VFQENYKKQPASLVCQLCCSPKQLNEIHPATLKGLNITLTSIQLPQTLPNPEISATSYITNNYVPYTAQ
jgi:hypothetical protein